MNVITSFMFFVFFVCYRNFAMSTHLIPPNFPPFFRAKETSMPICLKWASSSLRILCNPSRRPVVRTRGNSPPSKIFTEMKEWNSCISIVTIFFCVYCVFCVLLVKEIIPQKALNKKMNPAKAIGKTTPILKPQRITKTPMKICKSVKRAWTNRFVIFIFIFFF